MSWSSNKASIQSEVRNIRSELLDMITQLQQSCIGIGEAQLSRALNALRFELENVEYIIDCLQ